MHILSKGYRTLIHLPSQYASYIYQAQSSHQGVGKGWMLSWWAHCRARNTYTRTTLTSKTPTDTQHKESVPSLLHSPSGPAFPSSAIPGCGEESQPSSSVGMVPKHTRFIKQPKPSFPFQHSPKTNHCIHASKQAIHNFVRKTKENRVTTQKWWTQLRPSKAI